MTSYQRRRSTSFANRLRQSASWATVSVAHFFFSFHFCAMRLKSFFTRFLLVPFVVVSATAQFIDINVTVRNEKGAYATVLLGFDEKATIGIDKDLGEFAIPGFPPTPAGLQAALIYRDNGQAVLAYRDYRPLPGSSPSRDTFLLTLTPATDESRGSSLIFTWAYPLRQGVDSIVVSDLFGGLLYKVKFDAREADTVRGNALNLENFRIIVYTSQIKTSIEAEQAASAPLRASGIRAGEEIRCECGGDEQTVSAFLCDLRGNAQRIEPAAGTRTFPDVAPGLYVVRFIDTASQKVVAQRTLICE